MCRTLRPLSSCSQSFVQFLFCNSDIDSIMNGTRPNRRPHQYRGGQTNRRLTDAERKELNSPEYSVSTNGHRDLTRVLTFKETGVPYTKNYVHNKKAFDDLRKARFEKVRVWPRGKNGMRLKWADLQKEERPSGDAKDAAEAEKMNIFYPHQNYAGGLFCAAPFAKGEKHFHFESTDSDPNENKPISRALAIGEVRLKIMQYLSYHDIGALQGTCTLVANQIMSTPVSYPSKSTQLYTNILRHSGTCPMAVATTVSTLRTSFNFSRKQAMPRQATNKATTRSVYSSYIPSHMSSIFANTGVVRHDQPDPHGIQREDVPSAYSL